MPRPIHLHRSSVHVTLILIIALFLAGLIPRLKATDDGTRASSVDQDFYWSGQIDESDYLEIHGVNGDINVVRASGSEVIVTAQKHGHGDDSEPVRIQVVQHEDGITICAVYPEKAGEDEPHKCAPGDAAHLGSHNSEVEVDFTAHVPASVRIIGRTVNGDIRMESLASNIYAETVNGDIRISTKGFAEAKTVNGTIRATLGGTDWQETLNFKTVNGSIMVALPSDADTRVEAETTSGDISTEFSSLEKEEGWVGAELSGVIGSGGRRLTLETVNGSIRILKK